MMLTVMITVGLALLGLIGVKGDPCPPVLVNETATPAECQCSFYPGSQQISKLQCNNISAQQVPKFITRDETMLDLVLTDCSILEIQAYAFYNLKVRYLTLKSCGIETLFENAFKGVSDYMEHLTISNNKITTIPIGVFSDLPRLTTLTLMSNGMTSISREIFSGLPKILYLNLENNNIQQLPDNTFSNIPTLQSLYLNKNQITALQKDSLKGLVRLGKLYIWENNLATIHESSFDEMSVLKILELSFNLIERLPERLLFNCKQLETFRIHSNKLQEIPENLFLETSNLQILDLSHNGIQTLETYPFHFRLMNTLSHLYLQHNRINKILQETFEHLSYLTELHLDNNQIEVLEYNSLSGLYHLETLNIDHNNISVIPLGVFDPAGKLKTLDLSYNTIGHLDLKPFQSLKELLYLDISHNHLSVLAADWFDRHLRSVTDLRLNHNRIHTIANNSLDHLSGVKNLDLSHNRIRDPPDDLLHNCDSLQHLNLAFNPLGEIDENFFRYLTKMKTLDLTKTCLFDFPTKSVLFEGNNIDNLILSNNIISSISDDIFKGINGIKTLDLSSNNLTTFSFEHLGDIESLNLSHNNIESGQLFDKSAYLKSIKVLDVSNNLINNIDRNNSMAMKTLVDFRIAGNPVICDCGAAWLRSTDIFKDIDDILCSDPQQFREERLVCFNLSQLINTGCPMWQPTDYISALCEEASPQVSDENINDTIDFEPVSEYDFCDPGIRVTTTIYDTSPVETTPLSTQTEGVAMTTMTIKQDNFTIVDTYATPTSIYILWNFVGDHVLNYKITWSEIDSDFINETYIDSSKLDYSIQGLRSGTSYKVCVKTLTMDDVNLKEVSACVDISTKLLVVEDATESVILPVIISCVSVLIVIILIIAGIKLGLRKRQKQQDEDEEAKRKEQMSLNQKMGMWVNTFTYDGVANEEMAEQTTVSMDIYGSDATKASKQNGWSAQHDATLEF